MQADQILLLLLVVVFGLVNLPGHYATTTTPWPELGQKCPNNKRDFVNPQPLNTNLPAISLSYPVNNNGNGAQSPASKRDFVAPTETPKKNVWANPTQNSGRRDFVASPNTSPQKNVWGPPVNTTPVPASNSGRRDYVAPNIKPMNNANTNSETGQNSVRRDDANKQKVASNTPVGPSIGASQNTGRRDYIAPNIKPMNNANTNSETVQNSVRRDDANKQKVASNTPVGPSNGASQNTGRRDYVAPNINLPKTPVATQKPGNPGTNANSGSVQNTGNRDYVANNLSPKVTQNGPINSPTSGISYAQKVGGGSASVPTSTTKPTTAVPNKQSLDDELREFSETLIKKDTSNTIKHVQIDYQGMTRSGSPKDEAPKALLSINADVYKVPSVAKLISLHNNYILESKINEVYTAQEKIEENNFLDTILATPVMQHTRNFLIKKGKISKDPKEFRDLLKVIWFNMYSRGGGKIGSSGFEHVFLTEIKNQEVSGLHNWLYFNAEEKKNTLDYLGYMKKLEFDKGAILKFHFKFMDIDKPVGSMFIGTSPELEMAFYSTCFILRPDEVCPLRAGGKNFNIRTYTYRYRGKNMIGSAFPDI